MWPVTASRTAYENRWITVTEDTVEMPDGSPGLYGVVTVRHTSVFVVALTDADEVVLVRLDRPARAPNQLEGGAVDVERMRFRGGVPYLP